MKVESDGTVQGTKIFGDDGARLTGVREMYREGNYVYLVTRTHVRHWEGGVPKGFRVDVNRVIFTEPQPEEERSEAMSPELEFWSSFGYDHELEQWVLKPGVAPMDILEVCRKKLEADRASVASATAGVEQACDHSYCTCESECERCSKCGVTI